MTASHHICVFAGLRRSIIQNCQQFRGLLAIWLCLMLVAVADDVIAEEEIANRADVHALDAIFANQAIEDSGLWVMKSIRSLPPEPRFEFLRDWVMPGPNHAGIRLTTDFVSRIDPTNSPAAFSPVEDAAVVAPAIELIALAKSLGRLPELADLANRVQPKSPSERAEQQALQFLIANANKNTELAREHLNAFFDQILTNPELSGEVPAALLICLDEAARSPDFANSAIEVLGILKENFKAVSPRTAWHRHLWAIPTPDASGPGLATNQWTPVSRKTAYSHGSAYPAARWQFDEASVRKLTTHADDFLFFASPLQGDYNVEGHATGFGYRDSHLLVGGLWTGLGSNHKHFIVGDQRGELYRRPLGTVLTDTHRHGFIQTRINKHGNRSQVVLNGHFITEHTHTDHDPPWLAIRSMYRAHGGFDNLAIIGNPTVPDTIEMIGSESLLGWYDYYQPPGNNPQPLGPWSATVTTDDQGNRIAEITSPNKSALPTGSAAERLLAYTRPLLEDGVIEYEFWYDPDASMAHPAIGNLAYLISPDRVQLHQITDGRYERTTLRPDNQTPLDTSASNMPLQPNAWNTLQLSVQGDELTLTLNNVEILQHSLPLTPTNRTFGLFHYADVTALKVRNIRWTGSWPKQFPEWDAQPLADPIVHELDTTAAALPESVSIAMNRDSVNNGNVAITEGSLTENFTLSDNGITMQRDGQPGYKNLSISPFLSAEGDFDATFTFADFIGEASPGKIANVRMTAITDGADHDRAQIQRITSRDGDHEVQCLKMTKLDGQERRHYFGGQPTESAAGRLRLARRGQRIYYLLAENDSPHFRLIGEEEITDGPIRSLGFQCTVQIQDAGGQVQARAVQFDLKAENITGRSDELAAETLATLNRQRDELPILADHNFATTKPSEDNFHLWGDVQLQDDSQDGVEVHAAAATGWTSSGASLRRGVVADFDAELRFKPLELLTPARGKHTQIFLQIELANSQQTQVSAILSKTNDVLLLSQAQARTKPGNEYAYNTFASIPLGEIDTLRVARRGTTAYVIAGDSSREHEHLVGQLEIGTAPVSPYGVRLMLHPGQDEGVSKALFRSLIVRAASDRPAAMIPGQPAPDIKPPPTLFDSIRSLFD